MECRREERDRASETAAAEPFDKGLNEAKKSL